MNKNDHFCLSRHLFAAMALYPTQQYWKCSHIPQAWDIFVIANVQSFTSQIFGVVGPFRENIHFFSPLEFHVQTNSDHKTHKIKLYLVRTSKRYLNEKILCMVGVVVMYYSRAQVPWMCSTSLLAQFDGNYTLEICMDNLLKTILWIQLMETMLWKN